MADDAPHNPLPAWAVDLAVVVGTMAFALVVTLGVADRQPGEEELDAFAFGAIVAASLLLFGRRRWPVAVFAGTVALDFAYVWRDYPGGPGPCVAATAALATIASMRPLRTTLVAAGGALVAVEVAALAGAGASVVSANVLAPFAWITVGVLAGLLARSQRLAAAEARERIREAERTRTEEARRQLGEERLRIARELHDVLAHSLATIHVQASAGAHVVARHPEQAEQVLSTIKQASQEALDDLRTTVGVLRTGAESAAEPVSGGGGLAGDAGGERSGVASSEDGAPRRPAPSLARVEELLDAARRTGALVTIDITGRRRRLPAPVDVAGYRIVQEALTNVVRHAGATAVSVTVDYAEDGIALTVEDDGRGGAPGANGHGGGHGLAGMRERAALLGGTVETGARRGGGFRVHAKLPLPGTTT
jgi:signal transduction histidine kinase